MIGAAWDTGSAAGRGRDVPADVVLGTGARRDVLEGLAEGAADPR